MESQTGGGSQGEEEAGGEEHGGGEGGVDTTGGGSETTQGLVRVAWIAACVSTSTAESSATATPYC